MLPFSAARIARPRLAAAARLATRCSDHPPIDEGLAGLEGAAAAEGARMLECDCDDNAARRAAASAAVTQGENARCGSIRESKL